MTFKKILSITEARKKIFEMVKDVQKPGVHYLLTEKGKPKIVVMSFDEFDSLMETMEILSDPEAVKAIKEADKDISEGNWDKFVDLDDVLKDLNVSGKTQKKSSKKSKKT